MDRIRPKDSELIRKLTDFGKAYFTASDLERVLGLKKESLYVTLNRLTRSGVLVRPKKDVYLVFTSQFDSEKIANELYFPAYLSFEKALFDYGILTQPPLVLTFATLRPSQKIALADTEIEYSHLKKSLFFGYEIKDGKNVALPEKALLDELYLVSRGKRELDLGFLNLIDLDWGRFGEFAKKFPDSMAGLLGKVKRRLKREGSRL